MGDAELNGITRAVGEQFAREHSTTAEQIAAITLLVQTAQDVAAAAKAQGDANAARIADITQTVDASFAAARTAIAQVTADAERAGLTGVVIDGGRLVIKRNDGTEFAVDLPTPKSPDPDAVAVLVVERHLDRLRGDKGDKGDEGPPATVDLDELARILRAEPEFVASVRGERGEQGLPGAPCEPWCTGVHRAGVRRSHFIGRVYEATADTTDEPGESPAWRRIDTVGMRHIGPGEPRDSGDIFTKDGATFLFDGSRSWLLFAKAFTEVDAKRTLNPIREQMRNLVAAMASLNTVADLARAADANANEALRWISQHAPAIDRLLEGGE